MSLWRTKPIKALIVEASSGKVHLDRRLGPINLIFLGVGAIIGAGLFSITGIAAAENAGPAIILAFIIAGICCSFTGLCFSELASTIPVSGGLYSYTYATLGEIFAWMIGWALILEYTMGAATVAISWSSYLHSFLENIGLHIPIQLLSSPWQSVMLKDGSAAAGLFNLPAVLLVALLSLLLIQGVEKSAFINAILVVTKISVVLLIIGLGVFYVDPANYTPFIPENTGEFGEYGWSGILRASGIVFFAFIGFDAVSTMAQEVKNPQKTLPIGIIGSLTICTLLYVAFAAVLVGLVPYTQLNVTAPLALAIDRTPFPWLQLLVKLAVVAGMTSVVLVMLLGQSRMFFTMSKDGLLPECFSRLHPKKHTPWISNLILMIVVGAVAGFAPISLVGHLTSIATLLGFFCVCLSVLVLRHQKPHIQRPFRVPFVPLIPVLGMVSSFALMSFLNVGAWISFLTWLILGLVIYMCYGQHHSHLNRAQQVKNHKDA